MKNDLLKKSLDNLSINCSNEIIDQFDHYYDLLIDWNKKINLTAITEYDDVISKHFIDSILVSSFVDLNGKKIIDIGICVTSFNRVQFFFYLGENKI